MFEQPTPKPPEANAWPLVWTFTQKPPPDNRKKERCVVDGSKRWRRNMKMGHTLKNANQYQKDGYCRLNTPYKDTQNLLDYGNDIQDKY